MLVDKVDAPFWTNKINFWVILCSIFWLYAIFWITGEERLVLDKYLSFESLLKWIRNAWSVEDKF